MAPEKAKLRSRLRFHDWEQVLTRSDLPSHRKESWAITLRWYLSWAKRARVPVDFDSARDFIAHTGVPIFKLLAAYFAGAPKFV